MKTCRAAAALFALTAAAGLFAEDGVAASAGEFSPEPAWTLTSADAPSGSSGQAKGKQQSAPQKPPGKPDKDKQQPAAQDQVFVAMQAGVDLEAEVACPAQHHDKKVACLALALEDTLPEAQRERIRYPFTAKHAIDWSHLSIVDSPRNGVMLGELSPRSLEAFKAFAAEALGPHGYYTLRANILADQLEKESSGDSRWGAKQYAIAFLGDPSAVHPWMLQISGHHLAINRTYHTRQQGPTPLVVGIEPRYFIVGGRTYAPMDGRLREIYGLFRSLQPDQLAAAQLEEKFDEVLLGPGRDARFPEHEGLPYSHLNEGQKVKVREAVTGWVMDAHPSDMPQLLADYFDEDALARTYIAWSGSLDDQEPGSYLRIDGPRLWIESVIRKEEAMPGRGHAESVWRDRLADYGGCFF